VINNKDFARHNCFKDTIMFIKTGRNNIYLPVKKTQLSICVTTINDYA